MLGSAWNIFKFQDFQILWFKKIAWDADKLPNLSSRQLTSIFIMLTQPGSGPMGWTHVSNVDVGAGETGHYFGQLELIQNQRSTPHFSTLSLTNPMLPHVPRRWAFTNDYLYLVRVSIRFYSSNVILIGWKRLLLQSWFGKSIISLKFWCQIDERQSNLIAWTVDHNPTIIIKFADFKFITSLKYLAS